MIQKPIFASSFAVAAVLAAPVFAGSLCSDDRATRTVREIVQNAVPEWSVDLAGDFGDWARVERVKNLTKVTEISSIRAVSHDNDTQLTNCIAKITFALDDHTMSPEISYSVQPLEDKPDTLHVDVVSPYKSRVANRLPSTPAPQQEAPPTPAPQQAPQTTVVVNNLQATPAPAPVPSPAPTTIVPVPVVVPSPTRDTMNCWDLKVARNEVYARHGYAFRNSELSAHFSGLSWYRPIVADLSTIALSPSENRLVEAIKVAEVQKGCAAS